MAVKIKTIIVTSFIFGITLIGTEAGKLKRIYPPIENLNGILRSFETCLIHLINYRGLDYLSPSDTPVVSSRHVPAGSPGKVIFVEKVGALRNTTYKNISLNFRLTLIPRRVDYTIRNKKWRCILQVFMYPPMNKQDDLSDLIRRNNELTIPQPYLKFGRQMQRPDDLYFTRNPLEIYHFLVIPAEVNYKWPYPWWSTHMKNLNHISLIQQNFHADCAIMMSRNRLVQKRTARWKDIIAHSKITRLYYLMRFKKWPVEVPLDLEDGAVNLLTLIRFVATILKQTSENDSEFHWKVLLLFFPAGWKPNGKFSEFQNHKLHHPLLSEHSRELLRVTPKSYQIKSFTKTYVTDQYGFHAVASMLFRNQSYRIAKIDNNLAKYTAMGYSECMFRRTEPFCHLPLVFMEVGGNMEQLLTRETYTFTFMTCTHRKKGIFMLSLLHQAFNGNVWIGRNSALIFFCSFCHTEIVDNHSAEK